MKSIDFEKCPKCGKDTPIEWITKYSDGTETYDHKQERCKICRHEHFVTTEYCYIIGKGKLK